MNKQLQFVFLPANGASCIYLDDNMLFYSNGTASFHEPTSKTQHLYLLSDYEIKKGDWFYTIEGFEKPLIEKAIINLSEAKHIKKIIATTNPELHIKLRPKTKDDWHNDDFINNVAKISQSDIEHCISLYNNKTHSIDISKLANEAFPMEEHVGKLSFDRTVGGNAGFYQGYYQCLQDNVDKKLILDKMDIYSGELNAERIKAYKQIAKLYNIQESTVRAIFCAGAEWVIELNTASKEQPKSNTVMVEYESNIDLDEPHDPQYGNTLIYQPKLDKEGNIIIVR